MSILVRHDGYVFSVEEMTVAGEKHQCDARRFFETFPQLGPSALDSITLHDPDRVFAMLSCYYRFPTLRANIPQATAV
jgi:hypothetical protein